jgi:hypothetical protein
VGRAWFHAERFAGDPDPLARLDSTLIAADSVADILTGWAHSELAREPQWPALRSYMDRDMRRALRFTAIRSWSREGSDAIYAYEVDLLQYPFLATTAPPDSNDDAWWAFQTMALAEMRDTLATVLGLRNRSESDSVLHFLSSPDTAYRSLLGYVARSSGESTEAAADRWERVTKRCQPPDLWGGSDGSLDSLVVRLALPLEPDETNGQWDDDSKTVVWSGYFPRESPRGFDAPLVCSAEWEVPDSAAQVRMFGHVFLEGESLGTYCYWFAALDPTQQQEWNRMLKRLRPGKLTPLQAFSFSSKVPGMDRNIPGRDLILSALPRRKAGK